MLLQRILRLCTLPILIKSSLLKLDALSQGQLIAIIKGAKELLKGIVMGPYHVERLMYCCQEFDPLSRPPPVSFSPPKAPPISAPLVGIFTLAMPQSDPFGLSILDR